MCRCGEIGCEYRREHLFESRVLGASTATYFLPSAMLREYIALLASRPWINGIMLVLVLAFWPIVTMALR
ncbi:hypothetical protein JCM18909_585 [Cutibacterium acnes JCM 18909]|nr:hypothetical protein JCM18909_585 [Cutibacterium acnes JCM 18909]